VVERGGGEQRAPPELGSDAATGIGGFVMPDSARFRKRAS